MSTLLSRESSPKINIRASPSNAIIKRPIQGKGIHKQERNGLAYHDKYHLEQLQKRDLDIKKSIDKELENFDKNLISEMDRLIKISIEQSKPGSEMKLPSLKDKSLKFRKVEAVMPKLPSEIKSMSQIEKDYKKIKSSNVSDFEYSNWFSYKKQRETMENVMGLRCSLDNIIFKIRNQKNREFF